MPGLVLPHNAAQHRRLLRISDWWPARPWPTVGRGEWPGWPCLDYCWVSPAHRAGLPDGRVRACGGMPGVAEQAALSFGGLLRQLRAEANLTQEELAEAAQLSPRSV